MRVVDVKDASWEPYYNLHATTANGQPAPMVSLQYNARVTHTSGEDWADISFNFVAADAPRRGHNAGIPSVAPRKLHRLPTPFASVFPTPSLFGQNAGAAPPSNVAGGSLFSGPASVGSGSGFCFGAAQQSTPHNPPVAQQSSGLFGSAPPAGVHQPSLGQGLFGASRSSAPPAEPSAPVGQSLFGQAPLPTAGLQAVAPSGGALFGGQASKPANSSGSFSTTPQASTTKAPSLFLAAKPKIDNGNGSAVNGAVPDMRVTALGETVVVRESTSTRDVRLAAETKASVASDGLGHAIPITSLALDASFTWVCVPRSRAAAFVECHTKNSSVHTLVAGPLTVYVDGQGSRRPHCRYAFPPEHWSVHTDPVQDIKPNAAFFAPLGVDDAVRIVLRRAARTEEAPERPFVERLWTTACTARYAVTNGHAFAIPQLVLRDALPVSANPQIAVVVNAVREKDPRAADGNSAEVVGVLGENVREREGREGEGLFEWVRGVEAGQTVVLHAEWEIHTPSGVSWEEEPVMKP